MHQISTKQQQNTATIMLDEYCRYYSDFSKILGIYIKYFHPQLHFEVEQLLEASYNVWHHLSDDTKISLANFLEEINRESNRVSFHHMLILFESIRKIEYSKVVCS
ncbi:unnamed protein product [Rotaria magnacalcarata]|uniref:Uncharacterized protein n=1 Tax=Rotaria magnacalcarata TaxID=392030 RepID=A0A8S3GK27_9BILA|nr:unnamed protein product [Rotaria magnacalcarata]CAF5166563.1 unnamed protein product [Rotaria magnacalcarata]